MNIYIYIYIYIYICIYICMHVSGDKINSTVITKEGSRFQNQAEVVKVQQWNSYLSIQSNYTKDDLKWCLIVP